MNVLVTDGSARAALAVTRSLGARGHRVVVGDVSPSSLAGASRYCAATFTYPDPAADERAFVERIASVAREQGASIVLPVTDIAMAAITIYRDVFEPAIRIPFPDALTVGRAADKVGLLTMARRLGVPTPASHVVTGPDDRVGDLDLPYPLVVKPHRSRVRVSGGWRACSVSYANTRAALEAELAKRQAHEFPLILQERIVGHGLGVFACVHRGRLIAWFSHRRIREKPPTGGVSVLCESIPLREDAVRWAAALLDELRWEGVAMVEFKVSEADNVPYLMEINGRFWGSLQLAIDAGADFPSIVVDAVEGRLPNDPFSYRPHVKSRWLLGDLDSLLLQLSGKGTASGVRAKLGAAMAFLRLWERDLYYENPRWSDLGPARYEARQWLRALLGSTGHPEPHERRAPADKEIVHG